MHKLLSKMTIDRVYSVTTMYNEAGTTSKRVSRENWAIIIKYEGETVYTYNGKSSVSNINNMVILPKGISYEWKCTKAGHYISLEFESAYTHDGILSFSINNGEEILKTLQKLEYKRLSKEPLYQMESIRDTYTIILKLIKNSSRDYIPIKTSEKLTPAINHILLYYTSDMTNDKLAMLTGFSTPYFRQLFKEVYGISPIEYVKQLRIKKAKEMLRGDFGSITDIAISLGYSSIYDFSRDFKKHVGVSPSKYKPSSLF